MLFSLAFVFAYLLEGIINDLIIFSFLALVGEISSFIVRQIIKAEKEKNKKEETSQIVEKAVERASGRV